VCSPEVSSRRGVCRDGARVDGPPRGRFSVVRGLNHDHSATATLPHDETTHMTKAAKPFASPTLPCWRSRCCLLSLYPVFVMKLVVLRAACLRLQPAGLHRPAVPSDMPRFFTPTSRTVRQVLGWTPRRSRDSGGYRRRRFCELVVGLVAIRRQELGAVWCLLFPSACRPFCRR
jgi:hypothetical protein